MEDKEAFLDSDSALPWPREVRPPVNSQFTEATYASSRFNLMEVLVSL